MDITLIITVLQIVRILNLKVGTDLLSCAFLYDIFWVFLSKRWFHESVMIVGEGLMIPVAVFVIYYLYSLIEYVTIGVSLREWWNNQRMTIITTSTAWFIGFLSAMVKLLGISDTAFEITQKEHPSKTSGGNNNNNDEEKEEDAGRFTFEDSAVFVTGTTILIVQVTALLIKFMGLQPPAAGDDESGNGAGELVCSMLLVLCFWPYLKGLFQRGKYGIPFSTLCKSALLSFAFVQFSRYTINAA